MYLHSTLKEIGSAVDSWCDYHDGGELSQDKDDPTIGSCTGWINLEKLTKGKAFWDGRNVAAGEEDVTEAYYNYFDVSEFSPGGALPRLLRYNRKYRVTVKAPTQKENGEFNNDGIKDLNGLPFDGDKDEEKNIVIENTLDDENVAKATP